MKDIITYITEAKFDYTKDSIPCPDFDKMKVKKEFEYKKSVKCNAYQNGAIEKYFGWLTQWLNKMVPQFVKQIENDDIDFDKAVAINLPSGLNGELHLDWDIYWRDGKAIGSMRGAEIIVGRFCPANLGNSQYYEIKSALESYELPEKIEFGK